MVFSFNYISCFYYLSAEQKRKRRATLWRITSEEEDAKDFYFISSPFFLSDFTTWSRSPLI